MTDMFSSPVGTTQKQPTYEFTKRKRWAELLLVELADAIVFVVSSDGAILYCGAAVKEILGWSEEELIDQDFFALMTPEEQVDIHRSHFEKSLRTKTELHFFVHLRHKQYISANLGCRTTPDVLFEVKGRPHCVLADANAEAFSCIFVVAKPFPGCTETKLGTFLDLKMENQRNQQRLKWLKASESAAATSSAPPPHPTSSMQPSRIAPITFNPSRQLSDMTTYYSTPAGQSWGVWGDFLSSPTQSMFDDGASHHPYSSDVYSLAGINTSTTDDDTSEDGSKRKKVKKLQTSEQHVCITCGRTESPEWRKGPTGPKTLCNACGLRWAKQARKLDDSSDAIGDSEVVLLPP